MGVSIVLILIVVLVAIPARLVFAPLGGAGTPAQMMGIGMLVWWVGLRVANARSAPKLTRVQWGVLTFLASIAVSYVVAATRPVAGLELSAADRGLIGALALVGMALVTVDAPNRLSDLDRILRRLSWAGCFVACVGLAQFVTGQSLVGGIDIPGLTPNSELAALDARGGLNRPAGTATHPIEFGAVLTMILPVAIHYALYDHHRGRVARWLPVGVMAVAVPLSISRSALLSMAVALGLLLVTWPRMLRLQASAVSAVLIAGLYVLVPGLLGTLTGLFTGISSDTSAKSRTDSYGIAFDFIQRSLLFGRGFRTFLPSYRILDNQYLLTTIETGLVGLAVFGYLLVAAIWTGARARRLAVDPQTRDLAQALTASVTAAACSFALYDAFSFSMAADILFVLIGTVGALGRLVAAGSQQAQAARPEQETAAAPQPNR